MPRPLYPLKRTTSGTSLMSAMGQQQTVHRGIADREQSAHNSERVGNKFLQGRSIVYAKVRQFPA